MNLTPNARKIQAHANGPKRQLCRKCLHSCVPAVTLTFSDGARRLHWCAEHVNDAEVYRNGSDQS